MDDGRHDFDFLFGAWQIANRKRVNPLVPGDDEWIEFDAFSVRAADRRRARERRHATARRTSPTAPASRASRCACSSRRPGSGGSGGHRRPAAGSSTSRSSAASRTSVGRFECDDIIDGVHFRVRYDWHVIDTDTLRWEQSFSFDGRRTWETNWVMDSTRIASPVGGAVAALAPA